MSVTKSRSDVESAEMYARLEEAIEEMGELMVRTQSGEELELHKHNVEFEDEPIVRVDADEATHWFDASKVERYWVHAEI